MACPAFGHMVALRPQLIGKLHCAILLVGFSMDTSPGGRGSVFCELAACSTSPSVAVRGLGRPAAVAGQGPLHVFSDALIKAVRGA